MSAAIKLIVGLGNPGPQYETTRHNAGAWLVEELAKQYQATLKPESKFHGLAGRGLIAGQDIRLLIPTTFMNRSGQAIAAVAQFYKVAPEEILVAHDELDLQPGQVRLKQGGGHGGHNGLRDTISQLGNNKNFYRLRIGIGHPGDKKLVTGFVLGKAPASEQNLIDEAIDASCRQIGAIVTGDHAPAMNELHRLNRT